MSEPSAPIASLPWQAPDLAAAISRQRGHAVLVHASPGAGALEFGFGLAMAWLCEGATERAAAGTTGAARLACGQCASCRLALADSHPDLKLLLPEALRLERGLPFEPDERRKPSRQIRIDEVREGIDWISTSSARGRGKLMLIHPAQALNAASASALLKTLEEPPGSARIVLTVRDPALLMPTVVSRCQILRPTPAPPDAALRWLAGQGLERDDAAALLQAAHGQPLQALAWHREGVTGRAWSELPAAVARDDPSALAGWPLPRAVDALLKICHDATLRAAGGAPRFFTLRDLPKGADGAALLSWHKSLLRVAAQAEHPWNEPLLLEALVSEGAQAWAAKPRVLAATDTRGS